MLALSTIISSFKPSSSAKTHAAETLANRQWGGTVTSCTATKTTWLPPLFSTCYLSLSIGPCGSSEPSPTCLPEYVDPQHPWLPDYVVETGQGQSIKSDNSLKVGKLAGIVVGSVVGMLLLLVLAWYLWPGRKADQHGHAISMPNIGPDERHRARNAIPLEGMPANAQPHPPSPGPERPQGENGPNIPQAPPTIPVQQAPQAPMPPSPPPPPAQGQRRQQPVLRLRGGRGAPDDIEEDLMNMTVDEAAASADADADHGNAPLSARAAVDTDVAGVPDGCAARSDIHLMNTMKARRETLYREDEREERR